MGYGTIAMQSKSQLAGGSFRDCSSSPAIDHMHPCRVYLGRGVLVRRDIPNCQRWLRRGRGNISDGVRDRVNKRRVSGCVSGVSCEVFPCTGGCGAGSIAEGGGETARPPRIARSVSDQAQACCRYVSPHLRGESTDRLDGCSMQNQHSLALSSIPLIYKHHNSRGERDSMPTNTGYNGVQADRRSGPKADNALRRAAQEFSTMDETNVDC